MSTFNAGAIEASLTLNRSSWTKDLKEVQAQIDRLEQTTITIGIDADADNFYVVTDNVELFADDLDKKAVSVGIDADADAFYRAQAEVENMIELMDHESISVGVETSGLPKVNAELAELTAAIEAADANDINVKVKYDKNNLESLVGKADGGGGGGGGGSLGLLGILIAAAIALSPILSVAISALAAYFVAFTGALVAALAPLALLIGFMVYLIGLYAKAKKAGTPLTHGMQELASALHDLNDAFHKIVDGKLGDLGFGLMAQAIRLAIDVIPLLEPMLTNVIKLMDGVLGSVREFVHSPEFSRWLDFFGKFGVDMLGGFLSIIGNLVRFLINLFIAMKPFSRHIIKTLADDTQHLAEWSRHLGKDKGFQEWIRNAQKYGPQVLDLIGSIIKLFLHLGDALRPFAEPMIKLLDRMTDLLANMPTDQLTLLIGLGAGLYASWKFLPGIFTAVSGALELISGALAADSIAFGLALGPLVLVIAAAAALAAILVYLWTHNKEFRDSLISAWDDIKKAVMPIVHDLVAFFKEKWPEIKKTAEEVWKEVQDIFVQAAGIIQQLVFFFTQAVTWIWKHFGDQLMKILRAAFDIIIGVIKGAFQIIDGLFRLVNDLLHGRWSKLWGDVKQILRGAWTIILALVRGSFNMLLAIFNIAMRALGGVWSKLWDLIKATVRAGVNWIKTFVGSWVGWLSGLPAKVGHALSGMWDGLVSGFKTAINTIIDFWNGLHFGIPGFDPPGPGSFPGFDIGTPNIPRFAKGGVVDEPTIAMVGDASTPEIISPEDKMSQIIAKYSPKIDYHRMADTLAGVLSPLFDGIIDKDTLYNLLEKVAPRVSVDASNDDRSARALAAELSYELRVLGYGGAA